MNRRSTSGIAAIAAAPGQGACRLDLDADESRGVGGGHVLGQAHQAEPAVAIPAVEPALAPWPELRPADRLLGLARRMDHADHQPARARFERAHDRGIVGRRQPHEVVHPISLRGHGGQLDLLHANSRVLEVEPERIELAVLAHNLDQLGTEKLTYGENPDNLTFGKQLLDARHPLLPSA